MSTHRAQHAPTPPSRTGQLLRRLGSALIWTGALLLTAFGLYFSVANYPWFAVAVVLLFLLLAGYLERTRRVRQKKREAARMRDRARGRGTSLDL